MAKTAFKGTPVTLAGEFVKAGTSAPEFYIGKRRFEQLYIKKTGRANIWFWTFSPVWIPACALLPYASSTSWLQTSPIRWCWQSLRPAIRPGTLLHYWRHHQRYSFVWLSLYFRFRWKVWCIDDWWSFGRIIGTLGCSDWPGRKSGLYRTCSRNNPGTELWGRTESGKIKSASRKNKENGRRFLQSIRIVFRAVSGIASWKLCRKFLYVMLERSIILHLHP